MENFRNVNEDILKEWLEYRESTKFAFIDDEDKKHHIDIDLISEKILQNIPEHCKEYVQKQLEEIETNYMDYINYWNEKYYRNGFCDGMQLVMGSMNN